MLSAPPATSPPFTTRAGCRRAKSRRALAAALDLAAHEGDRRGPDQEVGQPFVVARRRPPAGRACSCRPCSRRRPLRALRSSASWATVRPRYSVMTEALADARRSRTSSTTATFSGRGFSIALSPGAAPGHSQPLSCWPLQRRRSRDRGPGSDRLVRRARRAPSAPWCTGGLRRSLARSPERAQALYPAGQRSVSQTEASSSSTSRARAGSMWTPGPIVEDSVTDLR